MPALSVIIDGQLIARVRTDGLNVLSVSLSGSKVDEPLATVEFSGGVYPEDGQSTYLTWISQLALHPGQCVRVSVTEEGTTTCAGKTLEDLFPSPPSEKAGPMPSREHLVNEVRGMPHARERIALKLRSSSGANVTAGVAPAEHGFGASFVWNWVRPERVSASLHTYSLDQLISGEGFNDHFRERLQPDAWVEVEVDS